MLVDHIWMLLLLQIIFSEIPVFMLLYLIVDHLMDASLVSEDFFGRSRISPIISFKLSLIAVFFRKATKRNFSEGLVISIGPFRKEGPAWSDYLEKMKSHHKMSKNCTNTVKIGKFLVRIIFILWDAFIICKINEKPGQMYQKSFITYLAAVRFGRSGISPII